MKYKQVFIVALFVLSLIFGSFIGTVEATDEDIAKQYAPILYFEKEETCYPVDVSYHIDNSYLYQLTETGAVLISESPSIDGFDQNFTNEYQYLDNQKGSVVDDGIINDYQRTELGNYTVYSHVVSTGRYTVVQYWMFYAFNKGTMNQHEGDWEMVQVVLSGGIPTQVMYSQHYSGQKANWNQVEKNGDHIKVYVSRGSHANYLRSYSGVVGIANDLVGNNGKKLTSNDYDLVMLESQSWLDFAGRWGWSGATQEEAAEALFLGQVGPNGPKFREGGAMWDNPIEWENSLIPANDTVFILEMILYNFVTIFVIITVILLFLNFFRIYRRHKKTGLGPRKISILYIDGLNAKSIGNILCIVGIVIALFSLVNPWYTISADISVAGYETHGMADMMTIDGINGIQIQVPSLTGPMPMGSVVIPFSLLIAISMIFLVIASIGIVNSRKLGKKYFFRGIKLLVPVVLIIIVVMSLAMIPFESMVDTGEANIDIGGIVSAISSSPFGGQQIVSIPYVDDQMKLEWGLGIGGLMLLLSSLILIISGFLEFFANTEFFATKTVEEPKSPKISKRAEIPNVPKQSKEPEEETDELPNPEDFEKN